MTSGIAALAVRLVFFLIKILPARCVGFFARTLCHLIFFLRAKDQLRIAQNVTRVYGLPAISSFSKAFTKQVFRHQIVSCFETIKASFAPRLLRLDGYEEYAAAVQAITGSGRGFIVVTGHMGSWELVGHVSARAAGGFHALAKPARLAALTEALEGVRNRYGIKVLWSNRKSSVREMLEVLRDGKALGFVMDQKPEGRQGPVVDFLGMPTEFVGGPAAMAIKTASPVLAVFCMRVGPWHYRIIFKEVLKADHGFTDAVVATEMMAREIENMIRLYPEQWAWNYKRWRFNLATA